VRGLEVGVFEIMCLVFFFFWGGGVVVLYF